MSPFKFWSQPAQIWHLDHFFFSGIQTYLNWTFVTSLSLASLLTISGYLGTFDNMFNPKEARTKVVVLAERVSWGKSQVNSFGVKLFQTYIVLHSCFFSCISGGSALYIGLLLFFCLCFLSHVLARRLILLPSALRRDAGVYCQRNVAQGLILYKP